MKDATWKVLYEGISYVENVIWRMLLEKRYIKVMKCYTEDVLWKLYVESVICRC